MFLYVLWAHSVTNFMSLGECAASPSFLIARSSKLNTASVRVVLLWSRCCGVRCVSELLLLRVCLVPHSKVSKFFNTNGTGLSLVASAHFTYTAVKASGRCTRLGKSCLSWARKVWKWITSRGLCFQIRLILPPSLVDRLTVDLSDS